MLSYKKRMKVYKEEEHWRCNESPTSAHHWVHQGGDVWKCKYCKMETDRFATSWQGWLDSISMDIEELYIAQEGEDSESE